MPEDRPTHTYWPGGAPVLAMAAAHHSSRNPRQLPGITAICSANPLVLQTLVRRAAARPGLLLLVESTSNQVNQYGGYTGRTPELFRRELIDLADRNELPVDRLLLGGDHLGPNAWQAEPAASAMEKGCRLVADCVRAGYAKLHLDASMRLGDDPPGDLPLELAASRTARLCQAAEAALDGLPEGTPRPCYVIGSEVPPAGGAKAGEAGPQITSPERARQSLDAAQQAFYRLGLQAAWDAVGGLVVQPGIEFGDASVHLYRPEQAAPLRDFIESVPGLVYEAHSTDYQPREALRRLVQDHFAILKVGPALTFALRQALFALEWIEWELLSDPAQRSNFQATLEAEMLADPAAWQRYYHGDPLAQHIARRFSLSDRWRYYWNRPAIAAAVAKLLRNLSARPIPPPLIGQFFPAYFAASLRAPIAPFDLIEALVGEVLDAYWGAGEGTGPG